MPKRPADRAHWSRVASQWISWARAPGHDAFWAYRQAFADFVGPGTAEALEVGCGEGRVSRELTALGYDVTACDAVAEMIRAAAEAGSARHHAVAEAARLPFDDASFGLIVAYNVLMDVEDMPAAVQEIGRLLRPDGRLVISLVHPFFDRGAFEGPEADAPFVVRGSYFGRERFEGTEARDGLRMQFAGWSQPLEVYADALREAGLAITALREPQPEAGQAHLERWRRIPAFLWLEARPLRR